MIRTEEEYWGDCWSVPTFFELIKQNYYMDGLGLTNSSPVPEKVVDLGGGPWSLLLRYGKGGTIVDFGDYPDWVFKRYKQENIKVIRTGGEVFHEELLGSSEVWFYNLLQHVESPEKILENARRYAPVIRVFDWINIPPYHLHPQMLTQRRMLEMLKGMKGEARIITYNAPQHYMCGTAFMGVFTEI